MRIRIIEHRNKETGLLIGYELQYKPFWWWPLWRKFAGLPLLWLRTRYEMEHEVFFALSARGIIKVKDKFH